MVLETVKADIDTCVYEIGDIVGSVTEGQLSDIRDTIMDRFAIKLSEHSIYIDTLSYDPMEAFDLSIGVGEFE